MAKKVASTHSSASALTTAVVLGHGPSSKVRTTSLSRRKSSCLKCSKPNPGPPVVSISTVRDTPSALGLSHFAPDFVAPAAAWGARPGEVASAEGAIDAGASAGAGATSGGAVPVVACCAEAGPKTSKDAEIAKANA